MNVLQRLNSHGRVIWRIDQSGMAYLFLWIIPLMFGLLSMKLGQDANWDFLNYHIYNPYALLNDKIGLDLAPAQMQTYFNPTIDLLYYGLLKTLPGPLVSLVMGVIHGLNFVLLVMIGRSLLPPASNGMSLWLPVALALAGVCSNGFISELGNTMGDNLVALAVLAALALLLRSWPALREGAGLAAITCAGIIMGIGVGLKLTVAVFALAMCASLLVLPLRTGARVRAACLFGVGVLLGMGLAGGYWYWKMWTMFGNPLFPQFNSIFHSPLAGPISVADTRFLPRSALEYLLWPFLFYVDPVRVSEMKIAGPIWPVVYVLGCALLFKTVLTFRPAGRSQYFSNTVSNEMATVVGTFFVLSYFAWMFMFSIYRYLVPIELLAPLVLWLWAQALLPRAIAGKVVAVLLLLIVSSNFYPRINWGYAPPARDPIKVDIPTFAEPAHSIVFTVNHSAPLGWMITQFPKQLAFVALGSNFPESPGYRQRISAMMAKRTGPMYAMFDISGAKPDSAMDNLERAKSVAKYQMLVGNAVDVLRSNGMILDTTSCVSRVALLGQYRQPYQMCRVQRAGT